MIGLKQPARLPVELIQAMPAAVMPAIEIGTTPG